jgi:type IV pilus biogenesis protein CpaD/CtpE
MIKTSALLLLALGLGACASQIGYHAGDLQAANEQLGQAVQQNIAAQTVNPQGSSEPVVASGARTAKAVAAYQADKVEKPKSAGTTSVETTGGGTGGN